MSSKNFAAFCLSVISKDKSKFVVKFRFAVCFRSLNDHFWQIYFNIHKIGGELPTPRPKWQKKWVLHPEVGCSNPPSAISYNLLDIIHSAIPFFEKMENGPCRQSKFPKRPELTAAHVDFEPSRLVFFCSQKTKTEISKEVLMKFSIRCKTSLIFLWRRLSLVSLDCLNSVFVINLKSICQYSKYYLFWKVLRNFRGVYYGSPSISFYFLAQK